MDTKASKDIPWASSKTCLSSNLTEWIKASSSFYANYRTLSDYLNTYDDQKATDPSIRPSIGHCATKELTSLLSLMRQELNTLLMDISLPKESNTVTPQIDEQLATHVGRLNRLNQRAQTMIGLLIN